MRLMACVAFALMVGAGSSLVSAQQVGEGAGVPCHVTSPNGVAPGSTQAERGMHGNRLLAVGPFGLWRNGTVIFKPAGAGFLTREGFLVMKFGWTLGKEGTLQVTGRRLDAAALPLRSSIGSAREPANFKPSYLIFPTPGCWEVTAKIAGAEDSTLTFVTRVVKIGNGPEGRWDPEK